MLYANIPLSLESNIGFIESLNSGCCLVHNSAQDASQNDPFAFRIGGIFWEASRFSISQALGHSEGVEKDG